jgi:PAS domain S-box-containing protein
MKRHVPAIALAVGMLLAGALLTFYLHQDVKRQVLSQFNESQLLIARQAAGHIESYFDARSHDVRYLASLPSLQHLDAKAIPADLQATFTRPEAAYVKNIVVVDATGKVVYATAGDAAGVDNTGSDIETWARRPASRGTVRFVVEKPATPVASTTGSGLEAPAPRLFLVTPLYQEPGPGGVPGAGDTFAGMLVLTVDLRMLAEGTLGLTPTESLHPLRIWVMDADGTLLLQAEHPEMVLESIRGTSEVCKECHVSFDYAEQMLTAKQGTLEYQLKERPSKVAAFAPMTFAGASWTVVVNAPKDDITGFMWITSIQTLGLFGVVGLVVGLTFLSVYRNSRQEIVLAEKAKHLHEKEQLVEQLRETSGYLENLFDSANAPIIVWNPELRVTRFNRASERLTGYVASEVVGLELRMLFPEESWEESLSKIVHALGGEERESPEIPIRRKDGGIRIALWNSANIRSGDGTAVIATIAQGQDITERKQTEQMKAEFVSFATHQLRTPLSGIRWLLELAGQDEGVSEEVASLVTDARLSAERLITLVNDLLAVSRIEGGRLAAEPQPVDLSGMTTDVVNELTPLILEKNQQISLPNGVSAPRVYADPKLVREVVLNLLSNAIKYTPNDGSIAVSMKAEADAVQWAVHDTGIGVPVAAERRLFEKFYRAENATVINTEGSGLGLYLVRLVLERSGGRVWCESEEGRGSTFRFTLPIAQEAVTSEEQ